jgi:hypothetical protein
MNATTVEIAFEVAGWPPTKNEAQSLLAPGHSHAPGVRDLLLAAQQATEASGWQRVDGPVRLEVVICGRTGRRPTRRNAASATSSPPCCCARSSTASNTASAPTS